MYVPSMWPITHVLFNMHIILSVHKYPITQVVPHSLDAHYTLKVLFTLPSVHLVCSFWLRQRILGSAIPQRCLWAQPGPRWAIQARPLRPWKRFPGTPAQVALLSQSVPYTEFDKVPLSLMAIPVYKPPQCPGFPRSPHFHHHLALFSFLVFASWMGVMILHCYFNVHLSNY